MLGPLCRDEQLCLDGPVASAFSGVVAPPELDRRRHHDSDQGSRSARWAARPRRGPVRSRRAIPPRPPPIAQFPRVLRAHRL